MPSLPELETYKRQFAALIGPPITKVEALDFRVVRAPQEDLDRILVGKSITAVDRYGKWLILSTGQSDQLIIHLGLKGKLEVLPLGTDLPKYAALAVYFDDNRRLVMSDQRHLGKIYVRPFEALKAEKQLGPDLLNIDEAYFTTTLRRKRRGARDVLMDQHTIAGIGGKYADEVLWQAKLHPNTKLDRLTEAELANLYRLTRSIHDQAIELKGDVEKLPPDWLIPHRQADKVCPRCHNPLTERSLGGSETHYCPHCQVPPNPFRKG